MLATYEKLEEILHDMLEMHGSFLQLLNEKRTQIIHNDLEGLKRTIAAESLIISQVKQKENERIYVINDWAQKLSLENHRVTISYLKTLLSPQEASRLEYLKRKILLIIKQINEVNQSNERLLQSSIQFIQENLRILSGTKSNTYSFRGVQDKEVQSRHIWNRSC